MQAGRKSTQSAVLAMASLDQIQQDLQILPQEALNEVYQLIQRLKKGSYISTQQNDALQPNHSEDSVYERFKASGLIGCVGVEEELSVDHNTEHERQLSDELARLNLQPPETADDTPLTSLIGSAPGNFATPAAADQFIRQERDEWDC